MPFSQSGRISDVYNPSEICILFFSFRFFELRNIEAAFITGVTLLGIVSLGAGFSSDKVVLIVLRALTGIGMSYRYLATFG